MKKQPFPVLLNITCIFIAFTVGLLIGRNIIHGDVQISEIQTLPKYANKSPVSPHEVTQAPAEAVSFPIDINSASKTELMTLPGIGDTLAQRILDYKTENGPFPSPEELLSVPGIGSSKLEAILDLITTGGTLP